VANTISVNIVGDVKDIRNSLKSVDDQLSGFGKSIGKVGGLLKGAFAVAAGSALVGQLGSMVTAASDLNETVSKAQTVFGSSFGSINAFAKDAAKNLGLSSQEALAGAAQFGNLFDQIGIGKKAAADMSKGFLQMSADLGSFNNADPSKVMEAFQSATRGEFDSLQQFIPTINAATLQTEALRLTHKKSADQLTEADKANALYSLSVKGMGKAQGDFQKTSGGLANQQRILSARFKDLQANIGQKLLPIALKVVTFFNSQFGPSSQKLGDVTKRIGDIFTQNVLPVLKDFGTFLTGTVVPALGALAGFIQKNSDFFVPFAATIVVIVAAMKLWAIAQAALNLVMSLNPIGLVVIAIAALVAGIIYAYKHSEKFRTVVDGAFKAIKTAVVSVINFFKGLPGNISTAVGNLGSLLKTKGSDLIKGLVNGYNAVIGGVASFFKGIAGKVLGWIGNVAKTLYNKGADFIRGLASGYNSLIGTVATFFKGIPGKVVNALGNVGSTLYNAGRNLLQGMINGIKSMVSNLISSVTGPIGDAIAAGKKKLGINSPSKVFKLIGLQTIQGLVLGLKNLAPVKAASAALAGAVTGSYATSLNAGVGTATLAPAGAGRTYQINVSGVLPGNEAKVGAAIINHIKSYEGANGSRWRNS
jgi:phage-related protein